MPLTIRQKLVFYNSPRLVNVKLPPGAAVFFGRASAARGHTFAVQGRTFPAPFNLRFNSNGIFPRDAVLQIERCGTLRPEMRWKSNIIQRAKRYLNTAAVREDVPDLGGSTSRLRLTAVRLCRRHIHTRVDDAPVWGAPEDPPKPVYGRRGGTQGGAASKAAVCRCKSGKCAPLC